MYSPNTSINSNTDIELLIQQYLKDIAELKALVNTPGSRSQLKLKLATIESSLHTTLAIQQMQAYECIEYVDYSHHDLPADVETQVIDQ